MSKEVEFKNRDRFIQLGLTIAALRKMQGMSQEQLAEKAKTLNIIRQNFTALLNAPEIFALPYHTCARKQYKHTYFYQKRKRAYGFDSIHPMIVIFIFS